MEERLTTGPVISVIVPVYNASRYLTACLDSVRRQSFDDFEVLLIDDGSTDGSGDICEKYCAEDPRFIVVHQANKGSSEARNRGLELSKGQYIAFVDADDWIDDDHLLVLLESIKEKDADLLISAFYYGEDSYQDNMPSSFSTKSIIKEDLAGPLHAGVWTQLVKKTLIEENRIRFPKYSFFEDMYFSICLLQYTSRIAYNGQATYHYRYNVQSLTNENDPAGRVQRFLEATNNLTAVFDRFNLWEDSELVDALYYRINAEKLRVLKCPIDQAGQKIISGIYPDSYKKRRIKNESDIFYRLALKYHSPFPIKVFYLLAKIKDVFRNLFGIRLEEDK